MPTMAALSVNDGQTTPVAHTFAVGTTNGAVATWYEKLAGIALGYFRLDYEVRRAKTPSAADRAIITLVMPSVADVAGVTTKVRASSAKVEFNFAQSATQQEKKDLVAYITNTLGTAAVKAAIADLEPYF